MRIAVIGAGAIGGLLGALLSGAGEEVTLVDINESLVETVNTSGLRIIFPSGQEKVFSPLAVNSAASLAQTDLVIISVKSYHTEKAALDARPLLGPKTLVLSVQNGAGNIETIASAIGSNERVIGGVFLSSVTPLKPGFLKYVYGVGGLKIGTFGQLDRKYLEGISDVFRKAGLETEIAADIQKVIWNKLTMNSLNCLAALTGIGNHEFLIYDDMERLALATAGEAMNVLQAKGLSPDNPDEPLRPLMMVLENFRAAGGGAKASMAQDLEAGRRTEIQAINGMVVQEGQRLGVPTPVNETFLRLVRVLEQKNFSNRSAVQPEGRG